jgi:cyclophilin family peptidyl-prolyl cis-trans isomerase
MLPILAAAALVVAGAATAQAPAASPKVLLKTTQGDITIELYPDKAPITVENFLGYVKDKFYDGLIFHRVIKDKIIQAGGVTAEMHTKSGKAPIKNESGNGLKNVRGFVAMARFEALDSATSQFYINVRNNRSLDDLQYCVFGKVIAGMDVVDAIAKLPTGTKRNYADIPLAPVTILTATALQ